MRITRVIAISVIAASMGLGVVHAQSLSSLGAPAEFPPASYKGKQYVDSRGCVYIRAGIDGSVDWVPRVTRDRKVICGFKPTFDKPVAGTAAAPKLDKNVVTIKPAAPETPTASKAPTAAPKATAPKTTRTTTGTTKKKPATTAAKPKAKPTTTRTTTTRTTTPRTTTTRTTTTSTPKPKATKPRTTTATAPATQTQPRRTTSQPPRASGGLSPCRNGSATYKGLKVRCGPQSESPVTHGSGNPTAPSPKIQFDRQGSLYRGTPGQVVRVGEVHPETRVVPRHVYENNLSTQYTANVPEGYRRVFDDGRLNPHRAEMTFAGIAQSDQVWQREVPRVLVDRRTGEEIVLSTKSSSAAPATALPQQTVSRSTTYATPAAPVVSTKSAPDTKALRLSGTPYVQVGTYARADQAQSVAKDVRRLGLPVRIGRYEKSGTVRRIVLAGPFDTVGSGDKALAKTRDAGFGGAFLRY